MKLNEEYLLIGMNEGMYCRYNLKTKEYNLMRSYHNDYFSDILFYDLYPGTYDEYDKVKDENTDIADNIFNEKWKFVDEAFKEVFGVDRHLA